MRSSIYINFLLSLAVIMAVAVFIFGYRYFNTSGYLSFSDGAKFADVARNLVLYSRYGSSFKFFSGLDSQTLNSFPFGARGILPGMTVVLYIFFQLFGVSDASVSLASVVIYLFSLSILFLLGKKYYGLLVATLAVLLVGTNLSFVEYSLNGASEVLIVLEMLLAVYLISLKTKFAQFAAALAIIAMYFTRFNAISYIVPVVFFWLISQYGFKKGLIKFGIVALLGIVIDRLILGWLDGKFFFYQILSGGNSGIVSIIPGQSPSDYLRVPIHGLVSLKDIGIKVFYNIYNFYKFIPQIFSPYLFALFLIGLFLPSKNRDDSRLKLFSLLLLISSILVYSLTIPFFRYVHPVIPFLYLIAIGSLSKLVGNSKRGRLASAAFVLFVLVNSIGAVILDSRFLSERVSKGKPPIYVGLSRILKENTSGQDIVVTNLDTWGSWYGERRTVWYPIKPEQLSGFEDKVDSIFLTSYLIDDDNYYMGDEWRQIFETPESPENEFIKDNYKLKGVYEIPASETYEKADARAVLLVRK